MKRNIWMHNYSIYVILRTVFHFISMVVILKENSKTSFKIIRGWMMHRILTILVVPFANQNIGLVVASDRA